MGEVVISSEEEEVVKMVEKRNDDGGGIVKWERFLPKMSMRVLLVEADDSTRQIIAALLRKCSYKVAAVADGLKAWELIIGRSENIDLILTEVELPSISGFALLTLIKEHETCKNIPVIMMSSHDSVSLVYKYMLRGATDFLMKPIRKNELTNLWQHVWRRQSQTAGGHGLQDESISPRKVEGTSENNAASYHSSGSMACNKRNKECIEKGSDAQSSSTKPDTEAESAYVENVQDLSQPKRRKFSATDMTTQMDEDCVELAQILPVHESEAGSAAATSKTANITIQNEKLEPEQPMENVNIAREACYNNDTLVNSSREAIDLIGAFDNNRKCSYRNSSATNRMNKLENSPHLDLSLRRSQPSSSENEVTDERDALNHSNSSAFSRYGSFQPLHSTLTSVSNQQREYGTDSDKHYGSLLPSYNSDSSCPTLLTQKSRISLATGQSGQTEIALPSHQQRVFPVPVPVRGINFDSQSTGYGSILAQIFCAQSSASPIPRPSSAGQKETSLRVNPFHQSNFVMNNSEQLYDQNAKNSSDQITQKPEDNVDSLEDERRASPTTDRSASSSFCNGNASQPTSIGCGSLCGSNGNINTNAVVRAAAAEGRNEGLPPHDGNFLNRSIQREAALTKFRLKRKDRCYEKKVRYESRKKLAEQRPRVKGQFVRQGLTEPSFADMENHCGDAIDC